MTRNTDDFFGGAPSLSWARQDENGQWVDIPGLLNVVRGGVVTAVGEPVQMTEFGTGRPLWWKEPTAENPAGEPKLKVVVTLRCDGSTGRGADERDRTDPSDTGERQLHVQSKDMRDAIGAACRRVGQRGVRVGGELYVAWTGKRPNKRQGGGQPARTWAALAVAPPAGGSADAVFDQQPEPAQAAPPDPAPQAVPTPPWAQQAPAAPVPAAPPTAPAPSVPPWQQPAASAAPPPAAQVPPWQQPQQAPPEPQPAAAAALPPWMRG